MNQQIRRRRTWQRLSEEDRQQRLDAMRRRQQRQVELEILRLHHLR